MGLESIEHVNRLTIAVHSGFQGKGIGEKMLAYLVDWARSAPKVEKLELNVRSVNPRAIRLYEKLGFRLEGRIRNRMRFPDGTYVDDLEMGLFVKSPGNMAADETKQVYSQADGFLKKGDPASIEKALGILGELTTSQPANAKAWFELPNPIFRLDFGVKTPPTRPIFSPLELSAALEINSPSMNKPHHVLLVICSS